MSNFKIMISNSVILNPKPIKTMPDNMQRQPFPLPIFRRGTKVKVFLGAGWSVGTVAESTQEKCIVKLKSNDRNISVFDARSIQEVK